MFRETAEYYDLIYSFKDYAAKARRIAGVLRSEHPRASTILDVACGTAEHGRHLTASYRVDGIDLEPRFVEIARAKVPSGRFDVADMTDFDLGRTYDVVQCLFSSIGYLRTTTAVEAALRCFRAHLAPGGIVLVEPWITPERFEEGHMGMTTVDRPDLKLCRMNVSTREGRISRLRFHYLMADGGEIDHRTETHDLALFTVEEMRGCFERAGLSPRLDPEGLSGRGLWIARAAA
jgi:SAM-dependent methyltransferase